MFNYNCVWDHINDFYFHNKSQVGERAQSRNYVTSFNKGWHITGSQQAQWDIQNFPTINRLVCDSELNSMDWLEGMLRIEKVILSLSHRLGRVKPRTSLDCKDLNWHILKIMLRTTWNNHINFSNPKNSINTPNRICLPSTIIYHQFIFWPWSRFRNSGEIRGKLVTEWTTLPSIKTSPTLPLQHPRIESFVRRSLIR